MTILFLIAATVYGVAPTFGLHPTASLGPLFQSPLPTPTHRVTPRPTPSLRSVVAVDTPTPEPSPSPSQTPPPVVATPTPVFRPVSTPTPAPVAAAPPAPKPTWTAFSGPGCSSSGTANLSFYNNPNTNAWHKTASPTSGYSCGQPEYSSPQSGSTTSWDNQADWVFKPGTGVSSCKFSIHIASGTWSTDDLYEVYNYDNTQGFQTNPFTSFHINQHANVNGWVSEGPISFSTGTIDVSITDAGTSTHDGTVADIVTATCS